MRSLAQARKLAIVSTGRWEPSPLQLVNLAEAVSAARQVKSNSRFYPQAQASLKSWQAYLEDLQQLQFAQTTAMLGHRLALSAAIEQAAQIAPNRPRRIQAQTLIAHWKREIERQEDRPQLAKARQLAEPDTISALQQAIAQAQQISLDRALRPEAQGLIYVWTQRIQTIEDQPILDRAWATAQAGNLNQAIQIARRIASGRALSTEARIAIGGWQNQIRARELARIRALREREAAAQRQREQTTIAPDLNGEPIVPLDKDSIEPPQVEPSRRSNLPNASAGSISPPERVTPRREPLPPLQLVPPPTPEPPAATPSPTEPALPPVEQPAIEKPVPALP
ncbi:MAG: hypothetical protein F6K28_01705 [Microcoleus sp. SIO2G3]|nr:hypothetical protein [Microcoleus sp. SIO2G3]